MDVWLVIGGVGVLLLLVVLIGTRRPRRAEDELLPPSPQSVRIDAPDSINTQASLKQVIRTLHAGRETGALQVTAGARTGSVYLILGHLFHATSGALTGEPALQDLLSWQDARYTFNKTAKLPTEVTIERSTGEVLG